MYVAVQYIQKEEYGQGGNGYEGVKAKGSYEPGSIGKGIERGRQWSRGRKKYWLREIPRDISPD